MNKKAKFIRPFEEIEPEIWGKDFKEPRMLWHIVTPKTAESYNAWFGIILFPKGVSARIHAHDWDEIYMLLEGQLNVEVGKEKYILRRYDTMYFPAGTKHQCRNFGTQDALLAWVYAPSPPAEYSEGWYLKQAFKEQ